MKNSTLNTMSQLGDYLFNKAKTITVGGIRRIAFIGVIAAAGLLTGCAGFGVRIPQLSNEAKQTLEDRINDKAARSTLEYTAKAMEDSNPTGPGIVIIGTLGNRTTFGFITRSTSYSSHVDQLKKSGAMNIPSKEQFLDTFDGMVLVATTNAIVGFSGRTVLTIKGTDDKFGYASLVAMTMIGPVGDLVVAQTNDHGSFYLQKTLCRRSDADYSQCSDRYRKGQYDRETGKPISLFGNLDPGGKAIDPATLIRLDYKPENAPAPALGRQQSFGSN
jgi:hypothetical protein